MCGRPGAARRDDPGGNRQTVPGELDDDHLEIITGSDQAEALMPRIQPNGNQRVNRFAFVIHPLSQEYFKKVKPIEMLSRVSPLIKVDGTPEKVMAYAPPFVYSARRGHPQPHRRRGRRLADLGGRHAARDHGPCARVHLPALAGRRQWRASSARRSWAWARSPRWWAMPGHGGQARAAAHHHRQQLQRLGRCGRRTMRCCA